MKIERPIYCPRCDIEHSLSMDLPGLISAQIGAITMPCPACGLVLVATHFEGTRRIDPVIDPAQLEYIKKKAKQMAAETMYSFAQWMDLLLTFRRDIALMPAQPSPTPGGKLEIVKEE